MTDRALTGIIDRFSAARVLVLGDVILDRYVSGTAARLSPEAPVPVLRPANSGARLGGAANVALNVAALGARATIIGLIGEDEAGYQLAAMVGTGGRIAPRLVPAPGRPTSVKTRFLAGKHQLLRLDEESTEPADGALAEALLAVLDAALPEADILVLSDYAKGVFGGPVLGAAIARAAAAGVAVIADPKRADFSAYRGATVLTPNEAEVRTATHIEAACDAEADRAGRRALDQTGGEAVLVTRSSEGLTLVRRGCPALHLPARAREVADVSGAGDTLVATLAVALAALGRNWGASLEQAASLANAAAGVVVGKQGTAAVSRAELRAALRLDALAAAEGKIASAEAAEELVAAWRAQGLRVGFANGCFDLIHPGHVRLLTEARAACDRLVVALNTDASVRRLKGPSRPVQDETARSTVMASLAPVDLVTLFDEDTPLALIARLRPDVLVKGSDYRIEQVVGADLVRGWGGQVLLVDLAPGHSTTGTIRRMAQSGS